MLLFTIKLTHSIIILYMMFCLYIIWQYALIGIQQPFLKWAFLSVIAEGIVWIAWGFECPLTIWAQNLGDDSGVDLLSELFLLGNVEYTMNFAIFFAIGTILSLKQFAQQK